MDYVNRFLGLSFVFVSSFCGDSHYYLVDFGENISKNLDYNLQLKRERKRKVKIGASVPPIDILVILETRGEGILLFRKFPTRNTLLSRVNGIKAFSAFAIVN